MARTQKPGINFYRMDTGHIQNKKVRLLFNEFDSDGYYIWHALIDYAYGKWGYYFDLSDPDELELFASEYCKKKITVVREVIAGCIRRGLFDEAVADAFGILTSDMMQETFLIATSERRAKESVFDMCQDWLLLDFCKEVPRNIRVVPCNSGNTPPKTKILPPKNPQRKGDKSRVDENRGEESKTVPKGTGGDEPPPPDPRKIFGGLEKTKKALCAFINQYRPDFIEPYGELWNLFAGDRKIPQVTKYSAPRRKKLAVRLKEKDFDLVKILMRAGQADDFLLTGKWFTFDWILENDSNYLKVLEGNFDKKDGKSGGAAAIGARDIDFLYSRFLEGQLESKVITEKHCDYLLQEGLIHLDQRFIEQAVKVRIRNLEGSNQSVELRAWDAYRAGSWANDPDARNDLPNLERIAKKFALLDLFNRSKQQNLKTIGHAATA